MKNDRSHYYGHRFPREIISYAVWVYHRFRLSFRDVEDLLAERGIIVSYETIRLWCQKFGPDYARKLKRRQGRLGDIWHLDEVFIRINGQQQYLWRAVDQEGDVIDILVQRRRDQRAEASHQPTRHRERQMRRFKSAGQAQRFLSLHGVVQNLFRVGRHLLRSTNHRLLRSRFFAVWRTVTAA